MVNYIKSYDSKPVKWHLAIIKKKKVREMIECIPK